MTCVPPVYMRIPRKTNSKMVQAIALRKYLQLKTKEMGRQLWEANKKSTLNKGKVVRQI